MDIPIEEKFGQFKSGKAGTKFCQVYNEAVEMALSVTSATALRLLLWASKNMDDDNLISLHRSDKIDFIKDCRLAGGGSYSISTVNKAVMSLSDSGFMVSIGTLGERAGRYFINPYLFWKSNNQKDRINRIKEFHELLNLRKNETN
jgi:hypothetical protein